MIYNEGYWNAINAPIKMRTSEITIDGTTYSGSDVISLRPYFEGEILRTVMRCVEAEIALGDNGSGEAANAFKGKIVSSVKAGAMTEGDEDFSSIEYGVYKVYSAEYSEENNSAILVCYDSMLDAMIPYDIEITSQTDYTTPYAILTAIATALNWTLDSNSNFDEYDDRYRLLVADANSYLMQATLDDPTTQSVGVNSITIRDVLDDLAQVMGANLIFNNENKLCRKVPTDAEIEGDKVEISAALLKEIKFNGYYDFIYFNGVNIYDDALSKIIAGIEFGYVDENEEPIDAPEHFYDVHNNPLFVSIINNADENQYYFALLSGIYNALHLRYYPFEMTSFGIGGLEFGDMILVEDKSGIKRNCLILKDSFRTSMTNEETASAESFIEAENSEEYISNSEQYNSALEISRIKENRILWSGAYVMSDSHRISLTETISSQTSGIVLVFSAYSSGTAQNSNWHEFFIPKSSIDMNSGNGHNFTLASVDFSYIGNKYLYISDKSILGNSYNTASGTNSGVTYHNEHWVLRYVIGV